MRRPGLVSVVLALMLALGFAVPLAPQPAHAQAGEIDQDEFDELYEEAGDTDPAYGPEDADLDHDPEIVTLAYAELEVSDFVASATFVNPFAGDSQQFDYGIQFRTATVDDEAVFARFIVLSTGVWAVTETGNEELVARGEYPDLDVSRGGENELTVIADGDTIHFAINGDYVGSGEVASDEPGDVAVGTAFLADSFGDGAVTEVLDFTVWSAEVEADPRDDGDEPRDDEDPRDDDGPFGGGRGDDPQDDPEDEPEDEDPQDDPEEDPQDDPEEDPQDEPDDAPVGTRYDAELFTFHFTYGEGWQLVDAATTDTVEVIQLNDGVSTLQIVIGQIWADQQACVEALLGTTLTSFENAGITGSANSDEGVVEISDSPFPGTFGIEVVFVPDGGTEADATTIYVECGPAGTNEYLVGVVQIVPTSIYEIAAILRQAVVVTFNAEEAPADEPEDEPRDDPQDEPEDEPRDDPQDTPDNGPDGSELSANVTENSDGDRIYLSPTYGFEVTILPGFVIEQDSVANGYDTLVIADEVGRVTVSGFATTNTPSGCINSILNNLNNDPSISAVQIALDTEGEEFRYDDENQSEIAVYLTFNNGLELGRYYACFANDARTSMLVVAYETAADVFPDEFENVDLMLSQIRVP